MKEGIWLGERIFVIANEWIKQKPYRNLSRRPHSAIDLGYIIEGDSYGKGTPAIKSMKHRVHKPLLQQSTFIHFCREGRWVHFYIELNMQQKSLKLPCGVENDELDWNRTSAVANKYDADQCERQNELWSRCQQRMEDNGYDHTTISHPNGNWEVVIDFDTVGDIAYRWYLLAEEKSN